MKYLILFILGLYFLGCKTHSNQNNKNCPEDGICTFKITEAHRLEVKSDDLGQKYYQLISSANHHILQYTYLVKGSENTMDGNQTETLLIEIPSYFRDKISKSDESLQDLKMIFDKQCFCRDQKVGVFEVKNGTLTLEKKATFQWEAEFFIPEISHVLKKFNIK
jgi:hypothetical protein